MEHAYPEVAARINDLTWHLRLIQLLVFMGFDALMFSLDIRFRNAGGWMWLIVGPLRLHMTVFACGTYITSVGPPPQKQEKRAPLAQPVLT